MCLGDLFGDVSTDIPQYQKSLFDKLEKPLFNAVGNHDIKDDHYEKELWKNFFLF